VSPAGGPSHHSIKVSDNITYELEACSRPASNWRWTPPGTINTWIWGQVLRLAVGLAAGCWLLGCRCAPLRASDGPPQRGPTPNWRKVQVLREPHAHCHGLQRQQSPPYVKTGSYLNKPFRTKGTPPKTKRWSIRYWQLDVADAHSSFAQVSTLPKLDLGA
jgi:hypothetical protein